MLRNKKVGIITLTGYFNYGNRLQNYAVQSLVKSLGYEPETIINYPEYGRFMNKIKYDFHKYKFNIFSLYLKKIIRNTFLINFLKKNRIKSEKEVYFKKFTDKNIIESNYKIYRDDNRDLNESNYHKFITGSDQVWNPHYTVGGDPNTFLSFASPNKSIALSPSFGVSELPKSCEDKYSEWLNKIKYLSCREKEGSKLIKDLTGKECEVLVDPTMMLKSEEWVKFSEPQKNKTSNKYLLTYFLGTLDSENKRKIIKMARDNELEIINLCDINSPNIYVAGPKEWVDYINTAEIFCTDSFHGVVFSIMLKTPFIAYKRGKMNSRINTLLSKFKLEERKAEEVFKNKKYFKIDFDHCEEILKTEREKAVSYLKNALEN